MIIPAHIHWKTLLGTTVVGILLLNASPLHAEIAPKDAQTETEDPLDQDEEEQQDSDQSPWYQRPSKRTNLASELARGTLHPYIIADSQWGDIAEEPHQMVGVHIGLHEDGDSLAALAYMRSAKPVTVVRSNRTYKVDAQFLGISFGGISESYRVFDGYGKFLLAGGWYRARSSDNEYRTSGLIIAQPELGISINLTSFMQFGIGASYQWLINSRFHEFRYGDLADWNGHVHLTIGQVE